LSKTKKKETFDRVAEMVVYYSNVLQKDAKKYGLKMFNMDSRFNEQIEDAIKYLQN